MGGISAERDVSLSTGKQILESLDPMKYDSFGVDAALLPGGRRQVLKSSSQEVGALSSVRESVGKEMALASVEQIAAANGSGRPDVVWIALHGRYGEDGTVQGMLELLGVPYTGSGVLASALAMDKAMAKKVMEADGICVPPSVDLICKNGCWDEDAVADAVAGMGYPVMVKPSRQGSTIGMMKVNEPGELNSAIREASHYDEQIIVEKFVEGIELTVGVLGNCEPFALPVVEIVPAKGFYDYEAKYTPGATEEIVPARISDETTAAAQKIAVAAHRSIGCRGMSRVDMICVPGGESDAPDPQLGTRDKLYVLEVNTIPGMTPTSLLPTAAAAAGISFSRLLDMIIEFALEEKES